MRIIKNTATINETTKLYCGILTALNIQYGSNIQLPIKQVNAISFINSHFFSFKKRRAAIICIPHFAPAIVHDKNIFSGEKYNSCPFLINHQVIIVDNKK